MQGEIKTFGDLEAVTSRYFRNLIFLDKSIAKISDE